MSDETAPSAMPAHDCCASKQAKSPGAMQNKAIAASASSGRGELIAKAGTVLSAIMASSCCWLPPLLIVFGVSGAGMVAALEEYRPRFMVVTFSFLAAAFYFTYRPRGKKGGDCCAAATLPLQSEASTSDESSAPAPAARRSRFNMMAMNKAMLWAVTAMAIVFLFFPQHMTSLFKPDDEVTADMTRAMLRIEGMTCPG